MKIVIDSQLLSLKNANKGSFECVLDSDIRYYSQRPLHQSFFIWRGHPYVVINHHPL